MDLSGAAIGILEIILGDTLLSYRELLMGDEELLLIWKNFISEDYVVALRQCNLIENGIHDYDNLSNYNKSKVAIAFFLEAIILEERGEFERAAFFLKNLNHLEKLWRLLGDMFLFKDIKGCHFDPNISLKYYKKSLDINSTDLNTWRNIGLAHEALGHNKDARSAYRHIALGDILLNLLYPLLLFSGSCLLMLLLSYHFGYNSNSWLIWFFGVPIIIITGISFRILKTNIPNMLRIYFKRY